MSIIYEYGPCPCPRGDDDEDNMEICYAEGCGKDKNISIETRDLVESVWQNVTPPTKFNTTPAPLVTARKLDIVRAQITGKAKPKVAHVTPNKAFCDSLGISRTSTRINYEMND